MKRNTSECVGDIDTYLPSVNDAAAFVEERKMKGTENTGKACLSGIFLLKITIELEVFQKAFKE